MVLKPRGIKKLKQDQTRLIQLLAELNNRSTNGHCATTGIRQRFVSVLLDVMSASHFFLALHMYCTPKLNCAIG